MADDPFKATEFIVLEFDPRNADVSVLASSRGGLRYTSYSKRNCDDAVQDAREAADRARARGCATSWSASRPRKSSPDHVTDRGDLKEGRMPVPRLCS